MNESDRIRLLHMLDAAKEALAFASGRERKDLEPDRMRALAPIKEVEIIGEAAARINAQPTMKRTTRLRASQWRMVSFLCMGGRYY